MYSRTLIENAQSPTFRTCNNLGWRHKPDRSAQPLRGRLANPLHRLATSLLVSVACPHLEFDILKPRATAFKLHEPNRHSAQWRDGFKPTVFYVLCGLHALPTAYPTMPISVCIKLDTNKTAGRREPMHVNGALPVCVTASPALGRGGETVHRPRNARVSNPQTLAGSSQPHWLDAAAGSLFDRGGCSPSVASSMPIGWP